MKYDEHHVKTLVSNERKVRVYVWQKPGLTYSYKQTVPHDLSSQCHAIRVTGGGIVFHSPGDVVFSVTAATDDRCFSGPILKGKMRWISDTTQSMFKQLGIDVDPNHPEGNVLQNDFCSGYVNPYECHVNGQKVAAFTIRRYKTAFIIQGIIHVSSNKNTFDAFAQYHPFLTNGLSYACLDSMTVRDQLIQVILNRLS